MKPFKQYKDATGIEYAMYPNPVMNITQSINGSTSHRGTNAIDDAQADTGISNGYAPCDMVCVATDYVNGAAMFWQSQRPVKTRKYGTTYIYFMVIHDNTANAYIGMKIPQGYQLFSEGTQGYVTGNHNHMEVGIGKYPGSMYVKSGYLASWGAPVYMLPGNVNPADVFFVDDTKILNNGGLNWSKITNTPTPNKPEKVEEEHWGVKFIRDQIRVHQDSPTGKVVGEVNTGDKVEYFKKTAQDGHRWVADKNNKWYAISGSEERNKDMWVELFDPTNINTELNNKPTNNDNGVEDIDAPFVKFKPKSKLFAKYGIEVEYHECPKELIQYKCPYKIEKAKGISTHNAGTPSNPSAKQLTNAMLSNHTTTSWHFSVDENMVVQGISLDRNCFANGDFSTGYKSKPYYSYEITRDMEKDERFKQAERNGAILAAELMYQNGWTVKDALKKHQDWDMNVNGKIIHKYCPHRTLDEGWDRYVKMVTNFLQEAYDLDKPQPVKPVHPEDKPNIPTPEENLNISGVNKLVDLLNKLVQKILTLFK